MTVCSRQGCTNERKSPRSYCNPCDADYQRHVRTREKKTDELRTVLQEHLTLFPEQETERSWALVLRRLGYGDCPARDFPSFEQWLNKQAGFVGRGANTPPRHGPRKYTPDYSGPGYEWMHPGPEPPSDSTLGPVETA